MKNLNILPLLYKNLKLMYKGIKGIKKQIKEIPFLLNSKK